MTYADLMVETSDDARQIVGVTMANSILDGGWTPRFDRTVYFVTRFIALDPSMEDPDPHPGWLGKGSAVLPRKRHPNTTITAPILDANVVASGLILFRAGDHTDDIGIKTVGCPYHVPWVWCEWVLTFDLGKFSVIGTGSVFPTHTFYAQGNTFGQQDEPTDAKFTSAPLHPFTIDTSVLRVYPVLTTGAPASGPQVEDTTASAKGPASSLPFAVVGSGFNSVTSF